MKFHPLVFVAWLLGLIVGLSWFGAWFLVPFIISHIRVTSL